MNPAMPSSSRILSLLLLGAAALPAQSNDFGKAYSFDERKPRTRVEQTIDKLLPSIVKVHGASGVRTIEAYGTGIVVSKQGHILTLDQVMVQKDRTRVVLYDGSVHMAELLPEEPKLGVKLLKIDPKEVEGGLVPVWPELGEGPAFRTGTFVVSLGNCFRLAEFSEKVSATFGVVVGTASTALRYRLADVKYEGDLILTDACNNPGHQGGGLFTLDGRWIGLNLRLLDSKETNTMLSAAIPARDLLPYLDEWVNGKVATPKVIETRKPVATGIVLFDPPGRTSPPAYVDRVLPDSPGAAIGLRPDDLIVRVDDFSIRTCRELADVLARHGPGDTVVLTWKRGNQVLNANLKLMEARQ
jgi:serine protease Do